MSEYNGEQAPPTIEVEDLLNDEALERERESHEMVPVVGEPDRNPFEPEQPMPITHPGVVITLGLLGIAAFGRAGWHLIRDRRTR